MDNSSEAIAKANAASGQESSSFPYDGIFSPHGFLSTISASTSEDRGDEALGKVDGQCEDQVQGQLRAMKKLKTQATCKKVTKVMSKGDLPPSQVAFGIDHILENILHFLDTSDLLKCRLVCRRWRIIATPELQKTVELLFTDDFVKKHHPYKVYSQFELRQLTRLLRQKSEISRSRFPCQKFEFNVSNSIDQRTFRSPQLRNFLDVYGLHVRSLRIKGFFVIINENDALAEIQEMLSKQTPKLQNLLLTVRINTSEENDAELILDAGFKNDDSFKMKSLKTLYISTNSIKIFEGVLQLCPNLEELVHDDHGGYHYRSFRKPLNRLHLLKEIYLSVTLTLGEIESLEKIVKASAENPGTLKLKRIIVNCWSKASMGTEGTVPYLDLERRFVFVLNQLLDGSWDTLETVRWDNMTFLSGMEWRQVMPKVKSLRIMISKNYCGRTETNAGNRDAKIFPSGRGLATIFPNLRTVEILYCSHEYENLYCSHELDFIEFLNRLNPEDENQVLNSVTTVRARDVINDWAPSAEALELLRKFFPKAEIQYPCPRLSFNPADVVVRAAF